LTGLQGMLIFNPTVTEDHYLRSKKMPIYEYRCKDCNIVFETFVSSITDADKVICKKCESRNVEKQISTFASKSTGSSSGAPAGALSGCSSKSGFS
jgi:putative FmdB family regulatory protein